MMAECWYVTDNGEYLFESENSSNAFGLFDKLMALNGFKAEVQWRYNKCVIVAVAKKAVLPTWNALTLVDDDFSAKVLEDNSVHDCATKMYNHLKSGKSVQFSDITLSKDSPSIGEFMINYILLGL